MKILLIGGTGTISSAITRQLATTDHEVWLLNRGNHNLDMPKSVHHITCDINDEIQAKNTIGDMQFDVIAEFVGFTLEQVERDYRLFKNHTKQYIYISSASAYNKPVRDYRITEGTTLANPYWEYSRNKIACEEYLMMMYRKEGFPVTIVRPSHTYGEKSVPLSVTGNKGSWQVLKRMLDGKPVIIHGDGTSLWTLTHNTDFAKAFIGLMGNPHSIGEVFQITSDESLTWNQIYEIVADALGVTFKPYHVASDFLATNSTFDFEGGLLGDKASTVVFDNTKIKNAVPGFQAVVRADEGIKATVEYVLSHKECQIEDIEFDEWCDKVIEVLEKAKEELK